MNLDNAKNALKKYFGFDAFRPLQAEVIQSIYDKKDVMLLMPTGGGKSVCFQIPAVTMEGTCLVVSPLISLMKDQVEALRANGIRAAFLNSSLTYQEQQQVENELYHGRLDLIYTSPEKMASQEFMPLLKASKISLFAIDEAHCISAWGHDFRPEYRQLKFLKKTFPNIPVIAVTATADKLTRKDIAQQLELDRPEMFVASFDRPNLHLEVRPGRKRMEQILEFIAKHPEQPGIIYCLAKKTTESVTAKLLENGINADFYHAGLDSSQRSKVQENFKQDRTTVICATIAFGMGIDKSNVRWVIHYNLPKNIESYYQEIGRSGRDGADADTLLFYSAGDLMTLRDFIQQNDSQYRDIHMAKLERMYQYATSLICRRKILLNYFNESMQENCGNCDVCNNPPQHFDGTVIAQKALSAVARLKEQVGTGMLVDVLRGSRSYSLLAAGFDKIKTYGAGKDVRQQDWFFYLEQLVNQGLLDIAYDDHSKVKLTEASKSVLYDGQKVQLIQADILQKRKEEEEAKAAAKTRPAAERNRVRDELFEHLRQLRLDISRAKGVPPYIVFTDATLEEMAAERPATEADLAKISGVGEAKLEEYGRTFLDAIQDFLLEKKREGFSIKGSTHLETLALYKEGLGLQEMADSRGMSLNTIGNHLIYLFNSGEPVDLMKFVGREDFDRIKNATLGLERPFKMKEIYEQLNEEVGYDKIRLALAMIGGSDTPQPERPVPVPPAQKAYSVEEVRQQFPKAYQPWTGEEDERLMQLFREGASVTEVARALERKPGAVSSRLQKLLTVEED
ncbi:MAG: DNA helicase RecQ [Saprospiraceae bacterium]